MTSGRSRRSRPLNLKVPNIDAKEDPRKTHLSLACNAQNQLSAL